MQTNEQINLYRRGTGTGTGIVGLFKVTANKDKNCVSGRTLVWLVEVDDGMSVVVDCLSSCPHFRILHFEHKSTADGF